MRKLLSIIFVFLLLVGSASALRYILDDTSGRGLYGLQNMTNVTANNFYYTNGTELVTGSGSSGGSGDITAVLTPGTYLTGGASSGSVSLSFLSAVYDAHSATLFVNRSDWTTIDNYPTQCAAGQFVYGLGDTLLCAVDSDTTYSSLSEFTDDLGARGYTHLSNFTDDLGHVEDNATWNEALANTLYADISLVGDNASWNQVLADSLYADISLVGDNTSWSEALANTLYADISVVDTDTNETTRFNNLVGTSCTTGNFIYNFSVDGTPMCDAPAGSGDITAVNTAGPYLTGGAVSGDVSLLLDESVLNTTIDARVIPDTNETARVNALFTEIDDINTTANIEALGFVTGSHTVDTNANTICTGTNVYLDGEGNCDTVVDTDTTYTAGGTLLNLASTTFSVNEGTLTNTYLCTYEIASGLVCNTDPSSLGGSGGITWATPVNSSITFDTDNTYDIGTSTVLPANIYGAKVLTEGRFEHVGDADTYMEFSSNNQIDLTAGNNRLLRLDANNGVITLNQAGNNFDTAINGQNVNDVFRVDGANDNAAFKANVEFNEKNITNVSHAHFGAGCIYHNGTHLVLDGVC